MPRLFRKSSLQTSNFQPLSAAYSLAASHLLVFLTYVRTSVMYLLVFLPGFFGGIVSFFGLISTRKIRPSCNSNLTSTKYRCVFPSVLHRYGTTTSSEDQLLMLDCSSNQRNTCLSQSDRYTIFETSPLYLPGFLGENFPRYVI